MALSIAVSGATGLMGQSLARLVNDSEDLRLVGGIARAHRDPADADALGYDRIEPVDDAQPILQAADVLIDFSSPDQLDQLLRLHAATLAGRALVVGTTGLDESGRQRVADAAEGCPLVLATNFSVGVNVLFALVEEAASLLPPEQFDIEVVETHHRRKADVPSGTALSIGRAIARARDVRMETLRRDERRGRKGEANADGVGFHGVRGGDVAGEHRVLFLGDRERLEIAHAAGDRSIFAEGALRAARWAVGKSPGRYSMRDVLGI